MIISRLAPTPNGDIHWGNLMNFILTWVFIKQNNGQLILRFDDIDQDRCELKYANHTKEILNFLGIDYETECSGQLSKVSHYKSLLSSIPHYVCTCSRQDIFKRTGSYHYDGYCRSENLVYTAQASSIRFLSIAPERDFVLWRKEDLPAYHLTSIKDDIDMNITHVIRGEDLLESSQIQVEIMKHLLVENKIQFIHHQLLQNKSGEKLSKSRDDGDIYKRLKDGSSAAEILSELAQKMSLPKGDFSSPQDFLKLNINDFLVERLDRI